MPTVFISHVAQDADIARQIADRIEAHGNAVSRPLHGASGNGDQAIERSDVIVLVISPSSFGSEELTNEITAGAKDGKAFLPVLISLSHAEFADRAPEWQAAIGAASSVAVPPAGVEAVLPRILDGVAALTVPRPSAPSGIAKLGRPRIVAVAAVVVLAGAGTVWAVSSGGGEASDADRERTHRPTPTTFAPGPLADAATTPLETSIGDFQVVRARLVSEVCVPNTDECATASGSDRFVLLTLAEPSGGFIPEFTRDFRKELSVSYVEFGDHRAAYTDAAGEFLGAASDTSFRMAYEFLPESAAGGDVRVAWPGSPTLRLDLR